MKTFTATAIVLSLLSLASAQVTYDNGTFVCASPADSAFCAGDSLVTNIIIRCSNGVGQPGNCNDNLAGVPPVGVKYSPCYQSSPTAGDAACSYNGIVYPDSGNSFPVPLNTSTTVYPTGTAIPTYTPSGTAGSAPSSNASMTIAPGTPTPTMFEGVAGTKTVGWAMIIGALGFSMGML